MGYCCPVPDDSCEPNQKYNPVDISKAYTLEAKGYTQVEIAQELGCSLNTLKKHMSMNKHLKGLVLAVKPTPEGIEKASNELKSVLSVELASQAMALKSSPVTYDGLFNSKFGQGRTSLVKSLVEAAKALYGWGNDLAVNCQALTLLCLSSSDSLSQGLAKPIEVEAQSSPVVVSDPQPVVDSPEPVQSLTPQEPQQG